MTVLTDTQVITASGGLVELGYGTNVADTTITAGNNSVLIGPITVVCDGSPVLVDVFYPRIDTPTNGEAYATVELDSVSQGRAISANSPAALSFGSEHHGQIRLTPSAGSHTFQVRGYANTASGVFRGASASGFPPAFLRVSKIVTATQWPAVTTGTIICTSSTRPASPFAGQQIYETDTSKSLIYNGTAWVAPQAQTVPPMCKATKSAVQSIPAATATVITLQTEDYDTDSMHSTTTNTSRITIGTAGVYTVTGFILSAASVAAYNYLYIYKNGTSLPANTGIVAGTKDGANAIISQITVTLSLAAADYVELAFYHNNAGAINVSADCWLSAHFVGKTA